MKLSKWSIFIDILLVLLTVSILYVVFKLNDISTIKFLNVVSIANNWLKSPISSYIKTKSECFEDSVDFLDDYFPGTSEGCICSVNEIVPQLSKIFRGNCNFKPYSHCSKIHNIPSIKWKKWNGLKLCLKKYENKTYFDLEIKKFSEECEKNCGIIDSLNNFMCVKSDEICPINTIKNVPLNNITLNDTQEIVLTHFRVSQDSPPCADSYYSNNFLNTSYILDNFYLRDKCYFSSVGVKKDYIFIDSIDYIQFLKENGLFSILNLLPGFPLLNYTITKIDLYAGNYPGVNTKCAELIKSKGKMNEMLFDMSNIPKRIYFIASILNKMKEGLLFTLFLIIIFSIIRVSFRYDSNLNESSASIIFVYEIIISIVFGFKTFSFYQIYTNLSKIKEIYFYFEIDQFDCYDDQTSTLFNQFFSPISDYCFEVKILILICIMQILLSIVDSILIFTSGSENRFIKINVATINRTKEDNEIRYDKLDLLE